MVQALASLSMTQTYWHVHDALREQYYDRLSHFLRRKVVDPSPELLHLMDRLQLALRFLSIGKEDCISAAKDGPSIKQLLHFKSLLDTFFAKLPSLKARVQQSQIQPQQREMMTIDDLAAELQRHADSDALRELLIALKSRSLELREFCQRVRDVVGHEALSKAVKALQLKMAEKKNVRPRHANALEPEQQHQKRLQYRLPLQETGYSTLATHGRFWESSRLVDPLNSQSPPVYLAPAAAPMRAIVVTSSSKRARDDSNMPFAMSRTCEEPAVKRHLEAFPGVASHVESAYSRGMCRYVY